LEAKEHKLRYSKHFLTKIVSKTLNFQILSIRVLKQKLGVEEEKLINSALRRLIV
jgi:hypothetical protein